MFKQINMTKEQERQELHRAIWAIANELRGSVDGWDFKSYGLGFLFYRFISEDLTSYINTGEDDFLCDIYVPEYNADTWTLARLHHSLLLQIQDSPLWKKEDIPDIPLDEQQMSSFVCGYSPDGTTTLRNTIPLSTKKAATSRWKSSQKATSAPASSMTVSRPCMIQYSETRIESHE